MLLRFRHCHNVTPAGGTGRSESLFLQQLRIAVPPCISLIIQHLFIGCSVPLFRRNLWFFTLQNYLLVCMIRYMYIYFIHRYTYISSCIFISCLLSVLKWTSPLNSFPSPTPLYLTSRAGRQATVHGRDLRPSSTTSYHLHPLRQHDTPLHKPSTN